MRRVLIIICTLIISLSVIVAPVYAATNVNGMEYPRNYYVNKQFPYINSTTLYKVEAFTISILEKYYDVISEYRVNLYFNDGACSFGTFKVKNTVRLTYNSVSELASRNGYDIADFRAIEVSVNTSEEVICSIGAEEDSGLLYKLTTWLSGAFQSVLDGLNTVKDAILEFLADAFETISKPLTGIYDFIIAYYEQKASDFENTIGKLFLAIKNLWEQVKNYTLQPFLDFFAGLSSGAIATWLSWFDLPIIKDFLIGAVCVTILGGLFVLCTSL